jgi:hypothetical protein
MNLQNPTLVPYIIPHYQGVPDIEKTMDLIALHTEVIYTQGMNFSYTISIGEEETKVIFSIQKKEIQ